MIMGLRSISISKSKSINCISNLLGNGTSLRGIAIQSINLPLKSGNITADLIYILLNRISSALSIIIPSKTISIALSILLSCIPLSLISGSYVDIIITNVSIISTNLGCINS